MANSSSLHELTVERIVPNGFGIGFADGLTVFVALAAPGDRVRVRETQRKGRIVFAEIVEILEPSARRIVPRCEYAGICGGCDFQHLTYTAQLDAKVGIVRDCLKRIGKLEAPEIEIIPSPVEFGYRSRAKWHLDTQRRRIGYFKRGSHDVIDVRECPILTPELQSKLTEIREYVAWEEFITDHAEIEAASSAGEVSVYSNDLLEPTHELDFFAAGERYSFDARSFFQGNQSMIEKLIELSIGGLSGSLAIDLYCGAGLFTLPLARRFTRVTGVESGSRAVGSARKNIERAILTNAEIFGSKVGDWLGANEAEVGPVDLVLLDPPRTGTERGVVESIARIRPHTISYVSCEPSTLARDLRVFIDRGFTVESITALDLFPQTHHVETVVRLA